MKIEISAQRKKWKKWKREKNRNFCVSKFPIWLRRINFSVNIVLSRILFAPRVLKPYFVSVNKNTEYIYGNTKCVITSRPMSREIVWRAFCSFSSFFTSVVFARSGAVKVNNKRESYVSRARIRTTQARNGIGRLDREEKRKNIRRNQRRYTDEIRGKGSEETANNASRRVQQQQQQQSRRKVSERGGGLRNKESLESDSWEPVTKLIAHLRDLVI